MRRSTNHMSSGALKKWNEGHDCRSTVPKTHICQPLPRCDKGRTCAKVDRKERTRQNFTAFFHSAHASTHAIAPPSRPRRCPFESPHASRPQTRRLLWPPFPPRRGETENKGTFDEKWWSFAEKSTVFIALLPCFSSHRHRVLSTLCDFF